MDKQGYIRAPTSMHAGCTKRPGPIPMTAQDDPGIAAKLSFLRTCVGQPVQTIETHMSWLVLGPERVLKLKKPVRYPFLDFTTPALREANARAYRDAQRSTMGMGASTWANCAATVSSTVRSC